jgi:hypothetical protein
VIQKWSPDHEVSCAGISAIAMARPASAAVWLMDLLDIIEQCHEAEVHVELLVAMEERDAGIISHKIHLDFLVASHHYDIFQYSRRWLSREVKAAGTWAVEQDPVPGQGGYRASSGELVAGPSWLQLQYLRWRLLIPPRNAATYPAATLYSELRSRAGS